MAVSELLLDLAGMRLNPDSLKCVDSETSQKQSIKVRKVSVTPHPGIKLQEGTGRETRKGAYIRTPT
jgi:hypothetical protein